MMFRFLGKTLSWGFLLALLAANLLVAARLYSEEVDALPDDDPRELVSFFNEAIETIRENYVDNEKLSYKDLYYGALRGVLQSLDPHSAFLEPDMFSDMKDDTAGQFGGLGIVISMRDNVLTIVAPMEDTPGSRAGLLSGDRIVEIDGESTEGMTIQEAVRKLRGPPDTDVTLRILRPETADFETITVTRAIIPIESVKGARMLEDGIGYVRITQFNAPTAEDLESALNELQTEGLDALVLDLRNNPGGLLNAAVNVSELFLPRGDLIVYTQGRENQRTTRYVARNRRPLLEVPMVVLINEGSASAAEIVAGALQDNRRAILVGQKSFGKGSVQSVLPLDDGSALRVTTAKYYTPSERVIDERGIEPDIVVPIDPQDWRSILIRRSRPGNATIDFEDEEDIEAAVDVQLERAVDVLKGVMIFEAENRPATPATERMAQRLP
jgi:carboxyl-terminal processing protease